VLARLGQIDGVEESFANETGSLIRLSLRPGADSERVAAAASRVLYEQSGEHVGVRLATGESAAALRGEEWRHESQVAERAAAAKQTGAGQAPEVPTSHGGMLWVFLLACAAVGLWLLWRHRKASAETTAAPLRVLISR
jgi:hypothetical protein